MIWKLLELVIFRLICVWLFEFIMLPSFYSAISALCVVQSIPWGMLSDDYNKKRSILLFFVKVISLSHVTQFQEFMGPFTPSEQFKHIVFMTTKLQDE